MSYLSIDGSVTPIRKDEVSGLFYVDHDGQARAGTSVDDLVALLRKAGHTVTEYLGLPQVQETTQAQDPT